jgi:predicted kinase
MRQLVGAHECAAAGRLTYWMTASPALLLLLVGPSGSGKTTVADAISAERGLYHLDGDPPRRADQRPFGVHRMRKQWDEFYMGFDGRPLAVRLQEVAEEKNAHGVVVTLPPNRTTRLLSQKHVQVARDAGIQTVTLLGPEELLFEAARDRPEGEEGPHDAAWEKRWRDRNKPTFDMYGREEFESIRVGVFRGSQRLETAEVVQKILALIT